MEYYAACDRAIRQMNRVLVEAFGRLKLADWDRVNMIRTVVAVYTETARKARKRYYEVAFESYLLMCALCDIDPKKAQGMAEKAIDPEWVDVRLKQTDFVTLYRFDSEQERKAFRLAEALEVPDNRNAEIDRALRLWSRQIGQYAINMTDAAMLQAMQDAGIEYAQWVTMRDERVCHECRELDGRVFPVDEFPPKPHYGCRCRMRPVLHPDDD